MVTCNRIIKTYVSESLYEHAKKRAKKKKLSLSSYVAELISRDDPFLKSL